MLCWKPSSKPLPRRRAVLRVSSRAGNGGDFESIVFGPCKVARAQGCVLPSHRPVMPPKHSSIQCIFPGRDASCANPLKLGFFGSSLSLRLSFSGRRSTQVRASSEKSFGELHQLIEQNAIKTLKVDGSDIEGSLKTSHGGGKIVVYGPIGEAFRPSWPERLQRVKRHAAVSDCERFEFSYKQQEKDSLPKASSFHGYRCWCCLSSFSSSCANFSRAAARQCRLARKAKLLNDSTKKVTFDDIAGVEEAKEELDEIIQFFETRSVSHVSEDGFPRGSPDGPAGNR